jgi:hypothetical protein
VDQFCTVGNICQHLLQFTVANAVFTVPAYRPQDNVTLKMPAFEWVHVLLRQQKMTISLSPADFCNSAKIRTERGKTDQKHNDAYSRWLIEQADRKERKNSRVRSAGDALTSTPAQSAEGMAVPFTTFAKTSGLTL